MKYLIPLLFFLTSCKEDATEEVISIEDLIGETGSENSNIPLQTDTPNSNMVELIDFLESQLGLYDTLTIQKPHSIDRFGFGTKHKIEFSGKTPFIDTKSTSVTPIARFYYYTFSDSNKTKNAFYNMLDCFGDGCNTVELNVNLEEFETSPMFTLVYDTAIVAVEFNCLNSKNYWKSFQDSVVAKFGKSYNYRIEVDCGGPLRWKQPIIN